MVEPPDDALAKEVFAHFGVAAYLAQGLERSLVTVLTTSYGPQAARLTERDLEQRFDDASEGGPVALLQALRDAGLSTATLPAVAAALNDGHRLTHHFFWERAADFLTADGCSGMIRDLSEIGERLRDCSVRVEAEVQEWAAAHGITREHVDAVHGAMRERGRVLDHEELDEVRGRGD